MTHEKKATLRLEHLSIGYASKKQGMKTVAQDINAMLMSGELTCLIGPNGIGKSTLLRTLCGFQPPLEGEIHLDGHLLSHYTNKQLAKKIGIVLTGKPDVENMTVEELVGLGRSPYTGFWGTLSGKDLSVVQDALSQVGLASLSHRMVSTLSDGERQKAMIAKAFAQQTPAIILDEPTAFLDFPSKVEMMQLLRTLAHDTGRTIFLSTHDLELTLQIADKIWLMTHDGIRIGTPRELAGDGCLSSFIEREGITFDSDAMRVVIG